ncbi:MAG: hypothetical protein QF570_19160 [Myxococcota bacterium]|nr:hypothetical protein [Myxococcota bacterium]
MSISETGSNQARKRLRNTDVLLLVALLAALSVSIFDLVVHWVANPWSRYSVVFAPLVAWVAYHETHRRRHPRLGALLIVVGMTAQLFSVMADTLALSRPALVCALMGLSINRGFASKRCALLSVFIIPIPYSVAKELAGLKIAEWWMSLVADALSIEHTLVLHVFRVVDGQAALEVSATHGGVPLLALALGLAGYAGLRLHQSLAQTGVQLLRWVAVLIPVQLLALALAVVALEPLGAAATHFFLDQAVLIATTGVIVYLTERRAMHTKAAANPA